MYKIGARRVLFGACLIRAGTYALPPAKRPPFNSGPILFEIPEPWQKGTLAQIL
jgi:hypothetical protein